MLQIFSRSCRRLVPHNLLLVYKNIAESRDSSSHVGLGVTAANIGRVLRTAGHRVEVCPVFDGYELDKGLRAARLAGLLPSHVVMFAPWVDTPWLQGLIRRWPHISFAVTYHSNVGFLQADRYAVRLLREQMELELCNHNFSLGTNCESLRNAVVRTFARGRLAAAEPLPAPRLQAATSLHPRRRVADGASSARCGLRKTC